MTNQPSSPNSPNLGVLRSARRAIGGGLTAAVLLLSLGAGPAAAQYGGGGIELFADPGRVPLTHDFAVNGRGCGAGATVTITIDGVSTVLGTAVASAGGFYTVTGIMLPIGLLVGTNQDVRATCGTRTTTDMITIVCSDGTDPVNGACPSGGSVVGGPGPTTTVPTAQGSPIAFTGVAFAEQTIRIGVTLLGVGILLLFLARRRIDVSDVCDSDGSATLRSR